MFNRRTLFQASAFVGSLASVIGAKEAFAKEVQIPGDFTKKVVGTKEKPIALNFNENSLGPSRKALKVAHEVVDNATNRYAFATVDALQAAVAKSVGLKPSNILLGNGSTECIQTAVQAFALKAQAEGKKCQLVQPTPTFDYAEKFAYAQNINVVSVPLQADTFEFDIQALKKAESDFDGVTIYYLCNPNNPTGVVTHKQILKNWVQNSKAYFILDEAYAELVNDPNYETGINYVKENADNVVVLRTFSKLYALAGYRVGYAVATEKTIKVLAPLMSLTNINGVAAVAAKVSLEDRDYVELSLAANDLSRKIVEKCFNELQVEYKACNANFIFHKIAVNGDSYRKEMANHGLLVGRDFPPLDGWNRLSLGTPGEMKYFVEVFTKLKKEGKA